MNKISYKGKAKIENDLVYKEDKNNKEIFDFLSSKDFNYYLPYIDRENNISKYKLVEDNTLNISNKAYELVTYLALLHNKTSYQTSTKKEKNIKIKEGIISYINYLEKYYNDMLDKILLLTYPSPSETLFLRYYSKINSAFSFIKDITNDWFSEKQNEDKTRICLIHNNISINHFLSGKEKYFISWDKATFDTPIKDLIDLYHELWDKVDFNFILDRYLEKCKLTTNEMKLFIINIAIPKEYIEVDNEYINTKNISNLIDYITKTEELIKQYINQ